MYHNLRRSNHRNNVIRVKTQHLERNNLVAYLRYDPRFLDQNRNGLINLLTTARQYALTFDLKEALTAKENLIRGGVSESDIIIETF